MDREGRPVSGAIIWLQPDKQPWDYDHETVTGADGSFRIGPMPSGEHEMYVRSASGYVQRSVKLATGRTLDLGAMVLEGSR
jgi:hypothetical protein